MLATCCIACCRIQDLSYTPFLPSETVCIVTSAGSVISHKLFNTLWSIFSPKCPADTHDVERCTSYIQTFNDRNSRLEVTPSWTRIGGTVTVPLWNREGSPAVCGGGARFYWWGGRGARGGGGVSAALAGPPFLQREKRLVWGDLISKSRRWPGHSFNGFEFISN